MGVIEASIEAVEFTEESPTSSIFRLARGIEKRAIQVWSRGVWREG